MIVPSAPNINAVQLGKVRGAAPAAPKPPEPPRIGGAPAGGRYRSYLRAGVEKPARVPEMR